ncbi:MAG: hypothetical protein AAGF11_27805 [Myxococcota bacterium]
MFKLGIDAGACRFEVRINDVSILASDVARPFDVEFPVSEWIVEGTNQIAALVQPPRVFTEDGEERVDQEHFDPAESALRLTLWVKRNGAPRDERIAITTLNFVARDTAPPGRGIESSAAAGRLDSRRRMARDDEAGDVLVSTVTLERDDEPPFDAFMVRDVTMPSPFPRWAWQDGLRIEDDEPTRDALVAELQRVWAQVAARDVAAVEQLQAIKATEYQAAYYLDDAGKRDALPLVDLMQTDALTLQPLPTDLTLQVFADGRLARLVDDDGDPPLVLVSAEDVGYFVGLTYCRTDAGWVLVR